MHKKITPLLDVNNSIVDKFKRGDHIDDNVLVLSMAFHRVVVVGHIGEDGTLEDGVD